MDRRGKSINALHQPRERLSSESFSFFISRLFKEHSGCFPHVLKLYAIYIYIYICSMARGENIKQTNVVQVLSNEHHTMAAWFYMLTPVTWLHRGHPPWWHHGDLNISQVAKQTPTQKSMQI